MRHATRWIAVLFIAGCLGLVGCMSMGRPIDRQRKTDIPLVAVPPPPLGRSETSADLKKVEFKSDTPPPPAARIAPPAKADKAAADNAPVAAPTVRGLLQTAKARCTNLDSYIVRLTRREKVGDTTDPEQVMLFKFRKQPWSVHLKWLFKAGEEQKDGVGREVVYVKGKHDGKIHTRLGKNDMILMPAGKRLALAPDNPLVRSSSRHPITEAGIAASVDRLAAAQAAIEGGDRKRGQLIVRAKVERPEFARPVAAIEHVVPAGIDSTLPRGGKRSYFFDNDTGLPMLIHTTDESGKEVEYYRYDRLQAQVKLDDADFDPDQLWGKPAARAARK